MHYSSISPLSPPPSSKHIVVTPFPSPTPPTPAHHTILDIIYASNQFGQLTITSTAPERGAQRSILVSEIEDVLGKAGALDDTANLDSAFFLDEFADRVEERWGELGHALVRVCVHVHGGDGQ